MYIKHVTFQSTRLSRASTIPPKTYVMPLDISIHKALASLDSGRHRKGNQFPDFNPQGSREPRPGSNNIPLHSWGFQSTRLSRASTRNLRHRNLRQQFQSTRLSRASTPSYCSIDSLYAISIHKALASLDRVRSGWLFGLTIFQSTRLSRASTATDRSYDALVKYFNPQGSREPRRQAQAHHR